MPKETTMTFRVQSELRTQFSEAAKKMDRPAAQVLRDLMRSYIDHAPTARTRPAISASEIRRRQADSNFAKASVALEGFTVPANTAEEADRFIAGEIDFTDFIERLYEQAGQ